MLRRFLDTAGLVVVIAVCGAILTFGHLSVGMHGIGGRDNPLQASFHNPAAGLGVLSFAGLYTILSLGAWAWRRRHDGSSMGETWPCSACNGSGRRDGTSCTCCGGRGVHPLPDMEEHGS